MMCQKTEKGAMLVVCEKRKGERTGRVLPAIVKIERGALKIVDVGHFGAVQLHHDKTILAIDLLQAQQFGILGGLVVPKGGGIDQNGLVGKAREFEGVARHRHLDVVGEADLRRSGEKTEREKKKGKIFSHDILDHKKEEARRKAADTDYLRASNIKMQGKIRSCRTCSSTRD